MKKLLTLTILFSAFILSCVLLNSCVYRKIYNLTEEELSWIASYKQGDTILFKSANETDTMIVVDHYLYNSKSPFIHSEADDIYNANGGFAFIIKHQQDTISGRFAILKKTEQELIISIDFGRKYLNIEERGITLHKGCYNKIYYNDAFSIQSTMMKNYSVMNQPKWHNLVWSKSKGLVQYTYANGATFCYYNRLPAKP